jgi:hypothetical protein
MKALIALEEFIQSYESKTNISFNDYLANNKAKLDAELYSFNIRLNTESPNDCNLPLTLELMKARNEYYSKLRALIEKGFNLSLLEGNK